MESHRTLVHAPAPEDTDRPPGVPPARTPGAALGRGPLTPRSPRQRSSLPAPLPDGGRLLGRYQLIELLGHGGFGEVWRARDELLQREVAVKRIPLAADGHGERAAREAQAAARLSHQAIVALYEAFSAGGCFYLVSELIDGQTLAALLAAEALEDEQLLEIGIALADALTHAHARGVVHRDIKPQNVLVPRRADGPVAKLTDFGGAALAGEQALTRPGDVIGTLAYMAPEQSEGRQAGAEADLYSLGLVLYEGLSGVNPVRGPTPAATARRIGQPLAALERHRRDLPRELTRAIDRAVAVEARDRGTLAELREALAEAARELTGAGGALPRPPLLAPWRRRASAQHEREQEHEYEHGARRRAAEQQLQPLHEGPPLAIDELPAESEQALEPRRASAVLPRTVWLGAALALVAWQAATGHAGVALLVFAAALPLLALPRRAGPGWLSAALAPALGFVGLAGCWPALAGQARSWRARVGLGALAYWWLVLAEPLLARHLWLGPVSGTPARAVWEGSLGSAAGHVLAPLLSPAVALGALLWALAALVLPWIVRGRSAALDVVAAVTWTAAVAAATPSLVDGLGTGTHHAAPRGLVLGAVLAGLIAVAARALRGPV